MKHPEKMTQSELVTYVRHLKAMIGTLQEEIRKLTKP
jgi:hypothetical protein